MNNFVNIDNVIMPRNLSKINFNKRTEIFEISCSLFSNCNLNCNFCFQDHKNKKIDKNKILELPNKMFRRVREELKENNTKQVYFRIYGGELLSDNIPDDIFIVYEKFINNINELFKNEFNDIQLFISWGTNGMYTKYKRVEKLLENTDTILAMSYDSCDRFKNNKQKEIWYNTFKYFYDMNKIKSLSIMMIKPCIDAYIKGDYYFNLIPKDVIIDINLYIQNPNYQNYQLTDEDTWNFYKWCLDNEKFNIGFIVDIINNKLYNLSDRYCYCKNSIFFDIDGNNTKDCVRKYSKLDSNLFYGKFVNEVNEENCTEVKNSLGLQKRGCLYCEYYSNCPTICWTSIIFKNVNTTICPIKRVYQYLEENPSILEKYNEWRKEYEKCMF